MGKTTPEQLVYHYKTCKVDADAALKLLKSKSLADGFKYYIGFNSRDGWLEIFKTNPEEMQKNGVELARELTAEEIDAYLAEKGLYLFASKAGWVTIRRIPKGVENEGNMFPVRSPDES